jgi:hypothetical protein
MTYEIENGKTVAGPEHHPDNILVHDYQRLFPGNIADSYLVFEAKPDVYCLGSSNSDGKPVSRQVADLADKTIGEHRWQKGLPKLISLE